MPFSDIEKLSLAEKLSLGISDTAPSGTSGGKFWYNELYPWYPIVPSNRVWSELSSIPPANNTTEANTNATNFPLIISKVKSRLTLEPTSNDRAYLPYNTFGDKSSGILDNWIQPSLILNTIGDPSNGYIIRLFHGDPDLGGTEIFTTFSGGPGGSPSWAFNYSMGIVKISTDAASIFKTSFYDIDGLWIVGYRYIGATGGGSSSGGVSSLSLPFTGYHFSTGYCNAFLQNYSPLDFGFLITENMTLKNIVFRSYELSNRTIHVKDQSNTTLYSFNTNNTNISLSPNIPILSNTRVALFIEGNGYYKYFNVNLYLEKTN